MKIGYARVTNHDQSPDLQIDVLKKAGCAKVYVDVSTGAKTARPEFDKMLTDAQKGDVIVICKLNRLGRSLHHLVELVSWLSGRGVGLESLDDPIDTTTSQGYLVSQVFTSLAKFAQEMVRERTQIGLNAARVRGCVGGHPKGLSSQAESTAMLVEMLYQDRRLAVSAIRRRLRISKSSLYRYLQHQGVKLRKARKSAKEEDETQLAILQLKIVIRSNNKFLQSTSKAQEAIERFCLGSYEMKKVDSSSYLVKILYRSEKDLEDQVNGLLREIRQEAADHNCQAEVEAWEERTARRW
jgi:DNA invertase Pin-like site-specific DNA recombinase